MTPPMVDWTDGEREAVINAMYGNGREWRPGLEGDR